jgi:hypothetical protein
MDDSIPNSFKYSAIMVEPRKHLAYELVLRNFLSNLSNEWQFHLFVGNNNEEYVRTIVTRINDPRVCIHNIGIPNLTPITYSKLFFDPLFYSFIPTETFLVFQTDSFVNPLSKHLIYEFLEYDYVGAPWKSKQVGNGGLSLRKKTKMLEIINKQRWNGSHWEDTFFSTYTDIHKPTCEHATFFSVETIFNETSFGIHNCWTHLTTDETEILVKNNPLLAELITLQGCENE